MGENCLVFLWLIVYVEVCEVLFECIGVQFCEWCMGDLLDLCNCFGVLVSLVYFEKVCVYFDQVRMEWLVVCFGGVIEVGIFVELIVVDGVLLYSWLFCEEIFGLLFLVIFFDDIDEVIVLVNDIVYGFVVLVYIGSLCYVLCLL